jgi:DNA-binding transcriptional ArsR family regulator
MAGEIDDDERTNALGLFNTARSYWRSAEYLAAANLKVTHPTAPVTFLFCHAIELYLKAYLRGVGKSVAQLKQVGHRIANLAKTAVDTGLMIEPEQSEVLSHIDDAAMAIEARYIVTGFKGQLPTSGALSGAATYLDQFISAALIKAGLPIRSEHFEQPQAPREDDLPDDTKRVLVHMFQAVELEDRDVGTMAMALRMEKGVMRYHLDRLEEAGFADISGSHPDLGHVYWYLLPEGRRYVVERKLM